MSKRINYKILFVLLGIILIMPNLLLAQETINPYDKVEHSASSSRQEMNDLSDSATSKLTKSKNTTFRARVIKILEEKIVDDAGGKKIKQQNLQLKGLSGDFKNKEIYFQGIDNFQVSLLQNYKVGDQVLVSVDQDQNGQNVYYIIDFIRNRYIYWLIIIFILVVLAVGRWKGLRAIISLLITFVFILKFILPAILKGYNPVLIGIGGGFIILFFIIYITEGISKDSHIAVASILVSLIVTGILAVVFSSLMRLTGMSEESVYLVNMINQDINFRGLLFVGVVIGSLGVLNDMVVSQISVVREIKQTSHNLSDHHVFKKAYRVGISHVSSMTNTLFLAYAGSALTILLLFSVGNMEFRDILNNYLISTEIFRGFIGAIGIVLSMPISTFLAVKFLNQK